jgi:hypothetical protein
VEGKNIADCATARRRNADLSSKIDNRTSKPLQFERLSGAQIDRHRSLHFGRQSIDGGKAIFCKIGCKRDPMRSTDCDHFFHDVQAELTRKRI